MRTRNLAVPAVYFLGAPVVAGTAPGRPHPGRVSAVAGFLNGDCLTVTGKTLADWVPMRSGLPRVPMPPDGHPLVGFPDVFKGPIGRIVAIDLNTGNHAWMTPHGDMAQRDQDNFKANPLMKGIQFDANWGRRGHPALAAASTLLLASGQTADNKPNLFGIDKKTGKRLGAVPTPSMGEYGLMTYMHQGKQFVVLPVEGGYTAMALP